LDAPKVPAQLFEPNLGSTLTVPRVTFTWSPSRPAAGGYFLFVGSTPGGSDIASIGEIPGSVTSASTNIPIDGNLVYVTVRALFSDGTVDSTTSFTTQSIEDAIVGFYTVPPSNAFEASLQYCQNQGPDSVNPTYTNILSSGLTISRDSSGSLFMSLSNVGRLLPTYTYSLPTTSRGTDEIVFEPQVGGFSHILADDTHGYSLPPTAFPGIKITRTYSADGTSGIVTALGLGPEQDALAGYTLTFEGVDAATDSNCGSMIIDDILDFNYTKPLR
jgi:hypothetical protein